MLLASRSFQAGGPTHEPDDDDRMPGTHRAVAAALLAYGVRGEHTIA